MENFKTNILPQFNEKYTLIIANELTGNSWNTVTMRAGIWNFLEVNEFPNKLKNVD